MRIGWTSNAPWTPSGYGVQTKEVAYRLAKDGHEVAIMANYGLAGSSVQFEGITIMGSGMETYSNDMTPIQIRSWINQNTDIPGLGITLYDVWVYTSPEWDTFPILSWVPIDHRVIPSGVKAWFDRAKDFRWALAMSKFGEQQMLEAGIERDRIFYAPHSFNPDIFRPIEEDIRSQIGVPEDAHLTIINSANKGRTPIRKCWPEMILAWSEFAKKRTDAYLYIHSDTSGIADGVNIARLVESFGAPQDRIRVVDQFAFRQGLEATALAKMYSASDVLLMTSRGEGFGIPVIEAQACGVPIIVTNWTAQPELVGSGWVVEGQEEWDEYQTGWWKVPSVDGIIDALNKSYFSKGSKTSRDMLRSKAIEFAKGYTTEYVFQNHWKPTLEEIGNRISEITKSNKGG
jgi:glycosyltransferase involved in cell wall biosynthesis